jgi:hypothetical protein
MQRRVHGAVVSRTRRVRTSGAGTLLAAFAGVLAACSGRLAHPPYVAQPSGALVEVVMPPPPGRVEVVPERPRADAVWIDGEWTWKRRRWAWTAGRWVEAPPGAAFSPWVFERGLDGRLWVAPGVWRARDASGTVVAPPEPLVSAKVDSAAVVNASGITEQTGTTAKPQLAAPAAPAAPAPPKNERENQPSR